MGTGHSILTPVPHVERRLAAIAVLMKALHKQGYVAIDHGLLLLHPTIREVMRYPFPKLSMLLWPCIEQTNGSLGCLAIVFVCLLKLAPTASTIDILPGLAVNEAHIVEPKPDHWSVFIKQILRIVWKFALQTSSYKRQIADAIQERPGKFIEWMEEQPVNCRICDINSALVSMSERRGE